MMPSENELKERYAFYSSDRLLLIIHNKEQYTAQAVKIARTELSTRNLSVKDIDIFLDAQEARLLAAKTLANVSLSNRDKALFFFLWFVPWFLGRTLHTAPENPCVMLKDNQSRIFATAGFVAFLLDGIVSVYFRLPGVFSIAFLLFSFILFQWVERKTIF